MTDEKKEKAKGLIDKGMDTAYNVVDNDKTLVIATLLIIAVIAMVMRFDEAMSLVDKISAGLLGLAVGRMSK